MREITLLAGETILVKAPPTGEPPPPPPPPPNPPPDQPGDIAQGDRITSGFWAGWRVRDDTKFIEKNGHGAMKSNTQGVRYLGEDTDGKGRVIFRVLFTHSSQLNLSGGKHLGGISSHPVALSPSHDDVERGSVRIDLDRPSDGKIRVHLYNFKDGKLKQVPPPAIGEEVDWANIAGLALGNITEITTVWERLSDTQLKITVNGHAHTFTIWPGSPNPGRYFYLGNMDSITGEIEFDRISWVQ